MAVRSKRLFGPTQVSTTIVALYTCPAGETALLKCLTAGVGSIGGTQVRLYLNGNGVTNQLAQLGVGNGESIVLTDLFIVLHPGDVLRGSASTGNLTITGFGAELEGVAD